MLDAPAGMPPSHATVDATAVAVATSIPHSRFFTSAAVFIVLRAWVAGRQRDKR
jgi:acid phosphatase family membrane protein YuiD